jgi:hypothetical protein
MSRRFMRKYLSPFFGTDQASRKIRPPYFWATLFCLLTAVGAGVQIVSAVMALAAGKDADLAPTIATLSALAAAMVAVYNHGRKVTAQSSMLHPPGAQTDAAPDSPDRPEGPPDCIQSKRGGGL